MFSHRGLWYRYTQVKGFVEEFISLVDFSIIGWFEKSDILIIDTFDSLFHWMHKKSCNTCDFNNLMIYLIW